MASDKGSERSAGEGVKNTSGVQDRQATNMTSSASAPWWKGVFLQSTKKPHSPTNSDETQVEKTGPERWSLGVLNDRETEEVPGSVLLLSSDHNEPLGIRNFPARVSASSLPSPYPVMSPALSHRPEEKKRTADGHIILDPQPDESLNDPLNWPAWKRDVALLSLGFYCMVGGGMTPVLAAGFTNVAKTYAVTIPQVARTTGLYMMGLGIGSVIASPTAILFGKRPVYLVSIILFCASSVWCAASPSYASLVVARVVQGISVSPCECLPSATIAEIFFLHERAYRVGVYTLLLLGGKNLIPLVSAAIIQGLGWRWVFWIVAMVVGLCFVLLFLFVPETFWDRTPRPKQRSTGHGASRTMSFIFRHGPLTPRTPRLHEKSASSAPSEGKGTGSKVGDTVATNLKTVPAPGTLAHRRQNKPGHVEFAEDDRNGKTKDGQALGSEQVQPVEQNSEFPTATSPAVDKVEKQEAQPSNSLDSTAAARVTTSQSPVNDSIHQIDTEAGNADYFRTENASLSPVATSADPGTPKPVRYTTYLQSQPPKTFWQSLKPWNGRLRNENWFHVACRPFILFAYPAVLWSTLVYSLSVGWLIVMSETVASVYRVAPYNFSALATGLVYLSPFVGGILGTAVAGKVSDIIVRFMSRRNGGLYEPEFRLVMAIPVALATCIGLMGFGWSAQVHDRWIVPTIFFGVISFGCTLGSTTAITFCVDSYRQYAGEALVTLNFSKNIFHGLVFSLFLNSWLQADGSKTVFLAIGGLQLGCLLTTIPMYIYGKRARMWTVRRNLMEKF